MSVAYDSGNSATGEGETASVALTCAANSLVIFGFWANNNPTYGAPTFDGGAPTLIFDNSNGFRVYSYRGHAAGSRTASVSWTGAQNWGICAVSVTGWDATTPIGTVQTATNDGLASIETPAIASAADGLIIDVVLMINAVIAAGAGQTERATAKSIQDSVVSLAMSSKVGAASTTMSWSAAETYSENFLVGIPINASATTSRAVNSISDATLTHGQTGVVVNVAGFAATGKTVRICPTDNVNDAAGVAQTVTAQDATSVTFTAVLSSFAFSTLYVFVLDGGVAANSNAVGSPISRIIGSATLTLTLRGENNSLVADQTGITLKVWRADTPAGSHSQEITSLAVAGGAGQMTTDIALGSLNSGDYVCWMAFRGNPASQFGAGRSLPTYA